MVEKKKHKKSSIQTWLVPVMVGLVLLSGVGFVIKVMLSDDLACVGTANLDNRSLRINFEISALAHGGTLAKQVEAMFHSDFEGCHGIGARDWSGRSWLFRAACRAARLMAPIQ
jgi:cardiolipin synthase